MTDYIQDFPKETLENMEGLWRNGQLCDVELLAGEAVIRAHRVVLAASSLYFRAMFTSQMAESGQRTVEIQGVESSALQALVSFAYSSKLTVSIENAQGLLVASNFLQMSRANTICSKFLQEHLTTVNCLDMADFAEDHHCIDLLEAASRYSLKHFTDVSKIEKFLHISMRRLDHLLSSNYLELPDGEEIAFNALVIWVKADLVNREEFFPELLNLIKLPLLRTLFFSLEVCANILVSNSEACMSLVREAAKCMFEESDKNSPSHLKQLPTQIPKKWWPRETLRVGEVIHILGGVSEHDTLGNVECYDPARNQWVVNVIPQMTHKRSGVGVAVLHGLLFAIGGYLDGKTSTDAVECYNPRTRTWSLVASMHTARMNLGVSAIPDLRDSDTGATYNFVFAVGGYSGKVILGSVERYDMMTDTWHEVCHMNTPRRNVGVGVIGPYLYAVGGSNRDDGSRSNLNSMERYDPISDSWTEMPPMNRSRGAASIAALNNCLYAVGGYDSGQWLNEVERFDPGIGQWTLVAPLNHCRTGIAVTALNGEVYAIGGYDGVKTVDIVEKYNEKSGKWCEVSPLCWGRSVPGVAVNYLWPSIQQPLNPTPNKILNAWGKPLTVTIGQSQGNGHGFFSSDSSESAL